MDKRLKTIIILILLIPCLWQTERYYVYNVHPWENYEIEKAGNLSWMYAVYYKFDNGTRILINLTDDLGVALNMTCENTYSRTVIKRGVYNQWKPFMIENYNTLVAEKGTIIRPRGLLVEPYVLKKSPAIHLKIKGMEYWVVSKVIDL